jgi:hypothetical protein
MKPRLLLVSAIAGTVFMTGLPSAARAGDRGFALEATRHMTVSSSHSAYTELNIPRDARLSLDYFSRKARATPRFSSGDEFGALLLVSEANYADTFTAIRLAKGDGVSQREISLGVDLCQVARYCTIPAGNYRLYLITDVALSVQIELLGLVGRSNAKLTEHVDSHLSGATESYYHSTPQGGVEVASHGAGFSPSLTGASNFVFSAFWFRGPSEPAGPTPADKPLVQVGDAGGCTFEGAPSAEQYAPGCPTGQRRGNFSTFRALSQFGFEQWSSTANVPAGQMGYGYYGVHTGIRDPGFVGFWLDLDG